MRIRFRARSTRSKRKEYSASAASPRARTSAMIAATASSTSTDDSRLAFNSATNRASKSGASASRNTAMANLFGSPDPSLSLCDGQRVAGTIASGLSRPNVAKLGFQTFHLEPRDRAVGESQEYHARWRLGLLERDGQQIQPVVGPLVREAQMRNTEHAIKAQNGPDPIVRPELRADPVIAHAAEDKTLLLGKPGHVLAAHASILNVGRNHIEPLALQRDEFQLCIGPLHTQPEMRSMSAPQALSLCSSRSKPRSR